MKKLKVLVDAIIFQKPATGGITRSFREVLPRMCTFNPELQITLFSDGPVLQALPSHPQISLKTAPKIKRSPRWTGWQKTMIYPFRRAASQAWNLTRSLWTGSGEGQIWHSTYYTYPERWRGRQVVSVYDMILESFPELFNDRLDQAARAQKRRCIFQADAIICNTDAVRNEILAYYGGNVPGAISVVPLACSEVFHRIEPGGQAPGGTGQKPFLLYVGRRPGYKNFSRLLAAYAEWEHRTEVDLVVVGGEWSPEEEALLHHFGITGKVRLLQQVDDFALNRLYNQALAFVYPSLSEGFGIPLLEAMACGCPIVASRIHSTLEVAGDYPTYFDPKAPGSILTALNTELNRGRAPDRLEGGFQKVKSYSWDHTAHQILDIYRNLD